MVHVGRWDQSFLARDASIERIIALLPWCSSVRLSVCQSARLFGTAVHCDHTLDFAIHFSSDLCSWLDRTKVLRILTPWYFSVILPFPLQLTEVTPFNTHLSNGLLPPLAYTLVVHLPTTAAFLVLHCICCVLLDDCSESTCTVDRECDAMTLQVTIVSTGRTSLLSTLDFAIHEMYANVDTIVVIACTNRRQTRTCSLRNLVKLWQLSRNANRNHWNRTN